jgi:alpha-galactosidase
MEFLNIARNASKYGDDPLAPAKWTQDAVFATVMTASPLAWFEVSEMSKRSRDSLRPIIAKWKQERERIHSGVVFPVGAKPDGRSWTGFAVEAADGDGGYAVIFRDGAESDRWRLDLGGILRAEKCEVLSGCGEVSLDGAFLSVSIPSRLGYVWVKLTRAD